MTKKQTLRTFKQEKLWRDKMPAYCQARGSVIHTKSLNDAEFDHELRIKFLEEADEVKNAQSRNELIEELADVFEVTNALLSLHGISKEELTIVQDKKRAEKGGFEQRAYVTIAQHPADSYSEAYCLAQPEKYPEIKE